MANTERESLFLGRIWQAGFVFGTLPFGFAVAAIFGANGVTFTVGLLVYLAVWGIAYAVAWWRDFGVKPDVLWAESTPVAGFTVRDMVGSGADYERHLTTCALNATGHRGPCTCGGRRG